MKKVKCLLLKTKDDRQFFTPTENFRQLIEFSRTFGAEISVIRSTAENLPILQLDELAPAICNKEYHPPKIGDIEILEPSVTEDIIDQYVEKTSRKKTIRKSRKEMAEQIREHIRKTLLDGKIIDVRSLAKKFSEFHLNIVTFSNHIRYMRDLLKKEGYNVVRIGVGQYYMVSP